MKRLSPLPELLSPAGSYEAALAAIQAGADAIYLGTKSFNARAYAQNFDDDALCRIIAYAHAHSVKVYVTLNTLVYDKELSCVTERARVLQQMGADALIVADLGAIRVLKDKLPELELHASTQATVHSSLSADELYSLGVSRVVLSRELSLDNIIKTTALCRPETEIFLHGALCVCHSGQCLFSSLVGGRSGNRGECAQPCRLPYNGSYPLSLRDNCLALHIPELIDSGVASLKIEGRMKSPQYVYEVTKIYRTLLDERRRATDEEMARLVAVFSRGGFTDRYLVGKKQEKMTGVRSEADKQATRELDAESFTECKQKITGNCKILRNCQSELSLSLGDITVTAFGQTPNEAISSPLQENDVKSRLCKMGATFFSLDPRELSLSLDEGLNLPPSALNSLRREAVEMLCRELGRPLSSHPIQKKEVSHERKAVSFARTACCFSAEQYEAVQNSGYFELVFVALSECERLCSVSGIYLPPVIFEDELDCVRALISEAKKKGAQYALAGNVSHYSLCREFGLFAVSDFRMNITNKQSAEQNLELGACGMVLSAELTLPQIRDIGYGCAIVYGRIPLMLLERCFMRECFGCKKCNDCALTDRRGVRFPLIREYGHRNLLLNSSVTYMGDKKDELRKYGVKGEHFIFTTETPNECIAAINAYKSSLPLKASIRRISK